MKIGLTDNLFKNLMIKNKNYFEFIVNNIIPNINIKEGSFKNVEEPSNNKNFSLIRVDLLYSSKDYLITLEANSSNDNKLLNRNRGHLGRLISRVYSKKKNLNKKIVFYQLNFNKENRLKKEVLINMQPWDKSLNVGEETIYKIEINLDVVKNKYYNNYKLTKFEKALLLLIIDKDEELRKIAGDNNMFKKVVDDIIDYNKEEIEEIIREEQKANDDYHWALGYDKGEKIGKKKKQLEIAKNLLVMGLPLNQITKSTGLSKSQVQRMI